MTNITYTHQAGYNLSHGDPKDYKQPLTRISRNDLCEKCRLKPFFLKPAKKGKTTNNKNRNDEPVIEAQGLRDGDFPQISPGQDRLFK